jgi:hypothetical protein
VDGVQTVGRAEAVALFRAGVDALLSMDLTAGSSEDLTATVIEHLTAWTDGGPTDLHNMCLLCRFHHREFDKRGWHAVMINNVPHWLPPAFIDPDRKPTRNTTHHLRDFEFKIKVA